jgi:orotidine-5'-phosphate decarboxylase
VNTPHFSDRLAEAVRRKGTALCVGLDPRWDHLPDEIKKRHGAETLDAVAAAFEELCLRVLEVVAPLVPAVKPQMAFFEACGPTGLAVLKRVLARARELGLLTILDGKRNDIASTAEAYADAAFGGVEIAGTRHSVWNADAITVNPYLGRDSIEPFLQSARRDGRGLFVLARTSNRGAGQFQDLVANGTPLYAFVARTIGQWGAENRGQCGLGDVGAVVGATHPPELAALRQLLPDTWFLIPGFGAQGGTAADIAAAFRPDGLGAIVNSARGITACFSPADPQWLAAVQSAAVSTVASLQDALPVAK